MSIMGPSVLTMGAVVTMAWGYTVTAQEAGPVSGAVGGPYLDSFTVQDSCQFNLCGPEYSQEFLLGEWTHIYMARVERRNGPMHCWITIRNQE